MNQKTENKYIYGIHAIIEAIQAGNEIDRLYVKKDMSSDLARDLLAVAREHNVPVLRVPVERINRISRKNHQGALAMLAAISYYKVEQVVPMLFEQGDNPFLIILDGVTDVRNFGAIARTCDCAGVNAIVIPERGSVSVGGDAIKTSAGALHTLPVCRENNISQTIKLLKNSGIRIVGATEKGDKDYTKGDYTGPVCLIMGAEDKGIPQEHLALCDEWARIPILGKIESLNVSVAAGVLMYEIVKQRLS